jgi:hypothetical protein
MHTSTDCSRSRGEANNDGIVAQAKGGHCVSNGPKRGYAESVSSGFVPAYETKPIAHALLSAETVVPQPAVAAN